MFVTIVNDIMYSQNVISTGFIVSIGIVFFIICMSAVLSIRFARRRPQEFSPSPKAARTLALSGYMFSDRTAEAVAKLTACPIVAFRSAKAAHLSRSERRPTGGTHPCPIAQAAKSTR